MKERERAIKLANYVLDRVSSDPDDDLAILARQFLREIERHGYCLEDVEDGQAICGVRMQCHLHDLAP